MNGPPSRNRRTSSSWASAARGIGALGCNASFLVIARSIGYAARCVSAVYPHILMGCPRYGGTGECTRENSIDRCQDSMGIRTIDNAEHGPSQWGDVEQTCCCFVPRVIGTVPIASRMITRPRFIREIFSIRLNQLSPSNFPL